MTVTYLWNLVRNILLFLFSLLSNTRSSAQGIVMCLLKVNKASNHNAFHSQNHHWDSLGVHASPLRMHTIRILFVSRNNSSFPSNKRCE